MTREGQRPTSPTLARLLVADDGSELAAEAASFAAFLAERTGATVTRVSAPEVEPEPSPARAILDAAAEQDADLILMGSHGVGIVRAALLGSTSAQVVRHAPCSVMLFRPDAVAPAQQARNVVVGVDGSEASGYALVVAQALAAALGARLVLVHAYDARVPHAGEPPEPVRAIIRGHGAEVLHEARSRVVAPLDEVAEDLVEGRPREVLVAAAAEHAPALLVVGDRGRGGFAGLQLGGTARWVASSAPCPVVVARTRR
jgi:nucleotide-binding universal stress UspA family protein